jgi:hypothetical protein
MDKKKILIITHTEDNESVDSVTRYINETGGEAIRFNVDQYPLQTKLTSSYQNGKWETTLIENDNEHKLSDIHSCWFRRAYHLGKGLKDTIDQEYLAAAMGELKQTLFGMLEGLECFQLARPSTYRRMDSKEAQLKTALACGLKIPATCISNDPHIISEFITELSSPAIAKMQSAFAIYRDGTEHVVFTNEVSDVDLEEIVGAQFCPMIFQQKLDKKLELRVTIVGEKIFAFSIDSQQSEIAKTDWRKDGVALLNQWQPFTLPDVIQVSLLSFMKKLDLQYGAIDLILTPDDEFYFLEVNAAGEFFWLDRLCEHDISKQIASLLLR